MAYTALRDSLSNIFRDTFKLRNITLQGVSTGEFFHQQGFGQ
jgi:hypothetical protein